MFKVIIAVIIGAFVVIGGFLILDPNIKLTNQGNTGEVVTDADDPNKISITVEGEVVKTGTYTFDSGTTPTFEELIDKAGGLTTNADEKGFYYETELVDGMVYYIPSLYDAGDVCSKSPINKVNINEDNADQLMSVSGITSSIANSIVSYRTDNGAFKTIEQLTDVYGIGNATYRKIRNYVILHS